MNHAPTARVQAPASARTTIQETRINSTRDSWQNEDREPYFKWETFTSGGIRRVRIVEKETGGGDFQIRLPFRTTNATRQWQNTIEEIVSAFWTVDLNTTIIDTSIRTGGIVDGIALAPSTDYLVWGFLDPTDAAATRFRGFGVTALPKVVYTAQSNGAKGSLTVFTLAGTGANRGFRFSLGSRVIIREGVTPTSLFNQGKVIAATVSSITILLDNNALYGNALLAASGTIFQINNFEPRMPDTGLLYPFITGGTKEYSFVYMGMIQTDTSSNIAVLRYRRDAYHFTSILGYTFRSITVNNLISTLQVSLTRYLPIGAYLPIVIIACQRGPGMGVGVASVAVDASTMSQLSTADVAVSGAQSRVRGNVAARATDMSVYTSATSTGAVDIANSFIVQGLIGWEW